MESRGVNREEEASTRSHRSDSDGDVTDGAVDFFTARASPGNEKGDGWSEWLCEQWSELEKNQSKSQLSPSSGVKAKKCHRIQTGV